MALNDAATLVIGAGNFFKAPTGTARPTDLRQVSQPWDALGHTSVEEIFSISSEGGEATVLQTLQNRSLRTRYSNRTEQITITLQQFDEAGLKLFYGDNMVEVDDDFLGVPTQPKPTMCAFLAVFIDGENIFAFYAPRAEIYRAEDLSAGDTESLAGMPLGIKPMQHGANDWTYAVTPLGRVDDPATP